MGCGGETQEPRHSHSVYLEAKQVGHLCHHYRFDTSDRLMSTQVS
jgi:hypothetical protein